MRIDDTIRRGLTNARAFQLFQLLRQGGLIATAIALAKAPLTVAEVGNYEMLTYLGYLLTFFWVSGFMQGLLSQYPSLEEGGRRQLIFQAFVLFTGVSLLVGAAVWWGRSIVLPLLVKRATLAYLGLFVLFLGSNLTASLQEHFYLLTDRRLALVVYGAVTMLAQLLVVALPPWLGHSFYYSFVGLAAVGLLKWIWLLAYVLRHGHWRWSNPILRAWWMISWPLGLYALVAGLNQALGPWLVSYFFRGDTEQFALYRYGARELPLLTALAGALGSAMIPAIARHWSAGLADLREETRKLYHIIFPLSILLLLTTHRWFPFVFSDDYRAAVPLFRTFLLITSSHLLFARTLLVARRDTGLIPVSAGLSFLTQLLLGFLLVPYLQLPGVALAAVLAFSLEKLLLLLYVRYKYQLAWTTYTPWRWWLGYTATLVGAYLFTLNA